MRPDAVVKIGGSHARSPLLRPWLRAVADSEGAWVLVPGGGPFADAVRTAQPAIGFDDVAAHDMGLLAMAQYGRALAALEPRFVFTASPAERAAALAQRRVPVWSPWPELRDMLGIPQNWDVTSDSLALWLARTLHAPRLLLVKHRAPGSDVRCARLVDDGLLDPAFPSFLRGFDGAVFVAGPGDLPRTGIDLAAMPGIMLIL